MFELLSSSIQRSRLKGAHPYELNAIMCFRGKFTQFMKYLKCSSNPFRAVLVSLYALSSGNLTSLLRSLWEFPCSGQQSRGAKFFHVSEIVHSAVHSSA